MATRIVICIDSDYDDPKEAYKHIYDSFARLNDPALAWESTDEWYDSDGDPIDEGTAQETRMLAYREINPLDY